MKWLLKRATELGNPEQPKNAQINPLEASKALRL